MKQARLKHYDEYLSFGEGYAIELKHKDSWELSSYYPVTRENYIHDSILVKLSELQKLGYNVSILP